MPCTVGLLESRLNLSSPSSSLGLVAYDEDLSESEAGPSFVNVRSLVPWPAALCFPLLAFPSTAVRTKTRGPCRNYLWKVSGIRVTRIMLKPKLA